MCVHACVGGDDSRAWNLPDSKEKGWEMHLYSTFIRREGEVCGCEGWPWRADGKRGELKKLSSPHGGSFDLAPADGCQLAMKTVARSEFSEDGNPDFFLKWEISYF